MIKSGMIISLFIVLVSIDAYSQYQQFTLEDCHVDGIKSQVKCGKLQVCLLYTS